MRFLHTADWHIGATSYLPDNVERQLKTIRWIFKLGVKLKIDALLVAGDVFHHHDAPARYKDAFLRLLLGVEEKVNYPCFFIEGNHSLSAEYVNLDTYAVLEKKGKFKRFYFATRKARFLKFERFNVLLIPYGVKMEPVLEKYRGAAQAKPTIVLAHGLFYGSKISERRVAKDAPKLPYYPEYYYYALGDVHQFGPVPGCPKAWYSGSPIQHTSGESLPKGVLLVEDPSKPELISTPTKVAKPIVKVKEGEPIPRDAYVIYCGEPTAKLPRNVVNVIPPKIDAPHSSKDRLSPEDLTADVLRRAAKEELEEAGFKGQALKERLEVFEDLLKTFL